MRIGELLDAAIKLYRARWKSFMGLVAVVVVPLVVLQGVLVRGAFSVNPFNPGQAMTDQASRAAQAGLIGAIFTFFDFLVIQPLLAGIVAPAAVDVHGAAGPRLEPRPRFPFARLPSILLVSVLTGLAVLGGTVLLVIPGIILWVRFSFGTVVASVEGATGPAAMGRSWRLTGGRFWKILLTLVLAWILAGVVAFVLELPLFAASFALGDAWWPVRTAAIALVALVARPFHALVTVLLYLDTRVRKEALDLHIAARDLGVIP